MSVKSAPYYWLVCDAPGCETKSTEGTDYDSYDSIVGALEMAAESEWALTPNIRDDQRRLIEVGRHYCDEHTNNVCRECNAYDDTRYAGERDYMCVSCAAKQGIHQCSSCGMADEMHDHGCTAVKA